MQMDQIPDEVQQLNIELQKEQHKRYLGMQTELDECESIIGTWNPANKFSSIYDTLDNIHDEIDEFNNNNEDSKMAQTPSSNVVPPTPGGTRRGTSIANKAKQFNTDLHQLQGKFQAMEDVTYD